MRITMSAVGSHGDVRPYVALALGLERFGHKVRIATIDAHEEFIKSFGIEFVSMNWEFPDFDAYRLKKKIFNIRTLNEIAFLADDLKAESGMLAQLWQACQGAEVIIFNGAAFPCFYIAEKLGIPSYAAPMQPHHQTRAFHYSGMPHLKLLGNLYNWFSYQLFDQVFWLYTRQTINQWRQDTLNLPPLPTSASVLRYLQQQKLPTLYSFSSYFMPRPSEWEEHVHLTGYWFLDTAKHWQPPIELLNFLSEGPPPIYISKIWDRNHFTKEVLREILVLTEQRIIVQTLDSDELQNTEFTDKICFIKDLVPHEWLFPKMAVVVHHGGLGTIMNCLRAGVASIAIPDPFLTDREFWSVHLAQSGLGIHFLLHDREKLSAKKLADVIKITINNKTMQARLSEISKSIQAEDGVQQAVEAFHKHLPTHQHLNLV
jgi:sterol 3beta-glucosyltransferase